MNKKLGVFLILIIALSILPILSNLQFASATGETIVQLFSYPNSNFTSLANANFPSPTGTSAQWLTHIATENFYITAISGKFARSSTGTNDFNITANIYNADESTNKPTGSALATSSKISSSSMTTYSSIADLNWFNLTFSAPYLLTKNSNYSFVYQNEWITGSKNCYIGYENSTSVLEGLYAYGSYLNGAWSAGPANMNFTPDIIVYGYRTYTIESSSDSHSSITPDGTTVVSGGLDQIYSYSADTGYQISSVLVDGIDVLSANPTNYTFTSITGNHTIAVTSEINEPEPTPTPTASSGEGNGASNCLITIKVLKDEQPYVGALVKLQSNNLNVMRYESTDAKGVARYDLRKDTYVVQVYSDNTLSELLYTGNLVVSKAQQFTISIVDQSIKPDPEPIVEVNFPVVMMLIVIACVALLIILAIKSRR